MDFEIWDVPRSATIYEIRKAFAAVLHSPEFFDDEDPKARRMNFRVQMTDSDGAFSHKGKGRLILPTPKAGDILRGWLRAGNRIR
jgi:RNA-dependent RNA polymerase